MTISRDEKIAVVKGGLSWEREVSLASGRECAKALRDEGYDVTEIDAGPDLVSVLSSLKPAAVLNALHGRWGEDGCVQGIFEWLKVPYTHSGVLASALAMNKHQTKLVYERCKLPTPQSVLVTIDQFRQGCPMAPPYVLKPLNEGSSLGLQIIASHDQSPSLEVYDDGEFMIEEYVSGRELSASVLDGHPLSVGEIITDDWFSYEAKYTPGLTQFEVPAKLPKEVFDRCLEYALKAHKGLGCKGLSRTDFRWDDRRGVDGLMLLETNTQPGMTATSQAPTHAGVKGMSFGQLCRALVEGASCNR